MVRIYSYGSASSRPPYPYLRITVHGIGMQQHWYPSHSKHLVLPPVASAGLTMLEMVDAAELPGPLALRVGICDVTILAAASGAGLFG